MTTIIREAINCDYEYIQYNKQLRLIHSIDDDMYQMKSILEACHSDKPCKDYFRTQSAKDILKEFKQDKEYAGCLPFDNRINVPVNLRGYYVHEMLVHDIARWASSKYAYHICKLLKQMAASERAELESAIANQQTVIQTQRPRMVPKNHEHDYKYLIWKEPHPQYPKSVILHLVRRNNSTFKQVQDHFENDDERWFYMDNLPISMSVNKDIIDIIKSIVPAGEYSIKNCDATVGNRYLPKLHEAISEYFDQFQS